MITLRDLNIHKECWKWIIKSTIRLHLICNQIYYCRGLTIKGEIKNFYYSDYENKVIARLDALKWVWERETGNETI